MRISTLRAATAAAIAGMLLLSGCSLLPGVPDILGGDSSNQGGSDGSDSGDDVSDNPFLDHGVPDGFPADVPLPDLEIYFSLTSSDDSWSIVYKADDLGDDFTDIVSMFEDDGWETSMNNQGEDGALGVFSKDPYRVQVMGVSDSGSDFDGPGFTFTVVRLS